MVEITKIIISYEWKPAGVWSSLVDVNMSWVEKSCGSGGHAVERRTINRGHGGSILPAAISKLRQFRNPTFACFFRKRH